MKTQPGVARTRVVLTKEQKEEIKQIFDLYDVNEDKTIEVSELRACLRAMGFKADKEEVKALIEHHDKDKTGKLDWDEFQKLVTDKIINRDPREEMTQAFNYFVDDKNGKITHESIKKVAKELGEKMTDEEIADLIAEADRDGDGKLNEEDFFRIMRKTGLFSN